MKNPYEILDIHTDATPEDVMEAYKKKAKEHHPDHGGHPDDFIEVNQAMVILRDPRTRKRFDEEGIIDDSKPDNLYSNAMERVAQFFIQSIEASVNNPLTLDDIDLIKGGVAYFQQQIMNGHEQLKAHAKHTKWFEGALNRLKTKRKDDVITRMIRHHMGRNTVSSNMIRNDIAICEKAIEVLKDYTFEQMPRSSTGLFPNTRRPEW